MENENNMENEEMDELIRAKCGGYNFVSQPCVAFNLVKTDEGVTWEFGDTVDEPISHCLGCNAEVDQTATEEKGQVVLK